MIAIPGGIALGVASTANCYAAGAGFSQFFGGFVGLLSFPMLRALVNRHRLLHVVPLLYFPTAIAAVALSFANHAPLSLGGTIAVFAICAALVYAFCPSTLPRAGHCPQCDYCLAGLARKCGCPECGWNREATGDD